MEQLEIATPHVEQLEKDSREYISLQILTFFVHKNEALAAEVKKWRVLARFLLNALLNATVERRKNLFGKSINRKDR